MNSNQTIARHARITAEFFEEHGNELPPLYVAAVRNDGIDCQIYATGNTIENIRQAAAALNAPVVITAHDRFFHAAVTVIRGGDGVAVNVWNHLDLREAMKLFMRLDIDPDTKVVELDAETLAKATEPDGGAER